MFPSATNYNFLMPSFVLELTGASVVPIRRPVIPSWEATCQHGGAGAGEAVADIFSRSPSRLWWN